MDTLGPNTNAPPLLLSPDVLLVCGEDESHLKPLLRDRTRLRHTFRQYSFWKQGSYTVILSAMGTGCVEPLLYEILAPNLIRRILLLGTAGKMPGAAIPLGDPHVISQASLAGTALDPELPDAPLTPRWPTLPPATPTATAASTDFFYGFGPRLLTGAYPFATGPLRQKYEQHLQRKTQLVDMEVAPFYAFCARFGDDQLQYAAIKGAANELGVEGGQVAESPKVIERCTDLAEQLLGLSD